MRDDFQDFKTEILVRLARLETKAEALGATDTNLTKEIEDLKSYTTQQLEKLDAKCTYIERDMPSASTYKFIGVVVSIIITAAVGIIVAGLR